MWCQMCSFTRRTQLHPKAARGHRIWHSRGMSASHPAPSGTSASGSAPSGPPASGSLPRPPQPPLNIALDQLKTNTDSTRTTTPFTRPSPNGPSPPVARSTNIKKRHCSEHSKAITLLSPRPPAQESRWWLWPPSLLAFARAKPPITPHHSSLFEKFFELINVFGADNVGMVTGDSSINGDAPVVCATAEIVANIALREGDAANYRSSRPRRIPFLR